MPPDSGDRHAGTLADMPDANPHILISLESSSLSVRTALIRIRAALTELGLDSDAAHSIELVLAEVLNNIGEHAYRGMDRGRIELGIWPEGDMLLFRTRDSGIPMPNENLPAGRAAALDCPMEEIPEGGFGWYLIRNLTADLGYDRVGNGNLLTFRMRRDARPING